MLKDKIVIIGVGLIGLNLSSILKDEVVIIKSKDQDKIKQPELPLLITYIKPEDELLNHCLIIEKYKDDFKYYYFRPAKLPQIIIPVDGPPPRDYIINYIHNNLNIKNNKCHQLIYTGGILC